jgi:hypothetical protein
MTVLSVYQQKGAGAPFIFNHPEILSQFLFVSVPAASFFSLMSGNFMSFSFSTAGHSFLIIPEKTSKYLISG